MMENDFDLVEFLEQNRHMATLIQLSVEDVSREIRKYWETLAERLRHYNKDDKLALEHADFYSDLNNCFYQIISDSLSFTLERLDSEMEEINGQNKDSLSEI